jgi:hypothetical protein
MSNHSLVAYALRKVGPMSTSELAAELEMNINSVRQCVWRARLNGKCHITAWKRENGRNVEVHAFGPGIDAERPESAPKVRRHRIYVAPPKAPTPVPHLSPSDGNPFATAMWNVAQGAR